MIVNELLQLTEKKIIDVKYEVNCYECSTTVKVLKEKWRFEGECWYCGEELDINESELTPRLVIHR